MSTQSITTYLNVLIRGPSLRGQGNVSCGARNPIVIVKIFIFIFLRLNCCRLNCAREGGAIWRVGPDSCEYLRHKKLHISACRGRYNLGKHVFAYNSQTVCRTFKNLVSPDSLNGAESLCNWPRPLPVERFFSLNRKNWKTYFFKLLLGILSDLHETWHVQSLARPDQKLSKEFCSVKECANY